MLLQLVQLVVTRASWLVRESVMGLAVPTDTTSTPTISAPVRILYL